MNARLTSGRDCRLVVRSRSLTLISLPSSRQTRRGTLQGFATNEKPPIHRHRCALRAQGREAVCLSAMPVSCAAPSSPPPVASAPSAVLPMLRSGARHPHAPDRLRPTLHFAPCPMAPADTQAGFRIKDSTVYTVTSPALAVPPVRLPAP